jgi:hypothetical protein
MQLCPHSDWIPKFLRREGQILIHKRAGEKWFLFEIGNGDEDWIKLINNGPSGGRGLCISDIKLLSTDDRKSISQVNWLVN